MATTGYLSMHSLTAVWQALGYPIISSFRGVKVFRLENAVIEIRPVKQAKPWTEF